MDRNEDAGLDITEEVVLEKYEGEWKEGDKPIEIIKIKADGTVERTLNPPTIDSSLGVNAQVLGVDNAPN